MKLFIALFCLISAATFSQTDSGKTYFTDPIVVTGTRIETLRKHLPLTISLFTKDDISNTNIPQVFSLIQSRVPGLFVTGRSNLGYGLAQGSAGQLTLRGVGSNPNTQVLILLDGRPQFMGLFGHPLPDNYITSNAERIEVVRGPCSFLYGTNAMGGVINIITRREKNDGYSLNLNQSYGSFASLVGDAGIGFKKSKFDGYVSFTHQQSNGSRPYSEFDLNNGYLKTGYKINDDFDLIADGNYTKFKTFDPGTQSAPKIDNWVDITRMNGGFTIENRNNLTEGALKLIYNYGEHKIYDGFHSRDRDVNVSFYQTLTKVKNASLSVGIDYKNYGGNAENTKTGYQFGEFFMNETGGYVHMQYLMLNKISFNAGLRLEHNSIFGNELIPQFGVSYSVKENLTFRTNISKGFRSPTIRELYLFPAPTPDLKPETMWSLEAGLQYNYKDILTFEPVFYYEEGSNIIQTAGVFPNLKLTNSGSFIIKGIELSLGLKPANGFELDLSASYVEPGKMTQSNPQRRLFAEAKYHYRVFGVTTSLEYTEKLYGANNSAKKLPDYALFNLSFSYFPVKQLMVYLAGENLLGRQYFTVYDYPMPGRTFKAGIKLNYNIF